MGFINNRQLSGESVLDQKIHDIHHIVAVLDKNNELPITALISGER